MCLVASVRPSVCVSEFPTSPVCNQLACADNCAEAVDRLLIVTVFEYHIITRDK